MKIIAVANLKGGVGKSTTTLFLAEYWALAGKKVLVIDLDPQSNSSFMLLSRDGLDTWERAGKTVAHFFQDARANKLRAWSSYIVPRSSDLSELLAARPVGVISMLPSIPRLWFEEYEFDRHCHVEGIDPVKERQERLTVLLQCLPAAAYDAVLIDCPPGFGSLTRAGLRLANAIVTPTIADYVSSRSLADFFHYGLRDRMGIAASRSINAAQPVYIVVSKYKSTKFQNRIVDLLKETYNVIMPPVGYRDDVLAATEYLEGRQRTRSQKYSSALNRDLEPMTAAVWRAIMGNDLHSGS